MGALTKRRRTRNEGSYGTPQVDGHGARTSRRRGQRAAEADELQRQRSIEIDWLRRTTA